MSKIGGCWRSHAGSLVARQVALARAWRRDSILVAVPALTILCAAITSPANAERLTYVCNVRYPDGNSDQTTVEVDTSVPSIDGKTDGEVEDFGGPCTHKISVTASSFSWTRECRTEDGRPKRSDSFSIDRLTGFYSELSSVGGESHVYRASGSCEKQKGTKPLY